MTFSKQVDLFSFLCFTNLNRLDWIQIYVPVGCFSSFVATFQLFIVLLSSFNVTYNMYINKYRNNKNPKPKSIVATGSIYYSTSEVHPSGCINWCVVVYMYSSIFTNIATNIILAFGSFVLKSCGSGYGGICELAMYYSKYLFLTTKMCVS